MLKVPALAALAMMLPGCFLRPVAWKGNLQWPDEHSARPVVRAMSAGAALAAAAAIREMIRTNPHPHLFSGCSSPEQGLEVDVFEGPTPGVYYVALEERFDRCGGPRGRVLDWWYVYAVTPRGEVIAEAPPPSSTWEDADVAPVPPSHAPAEPVPPTAPSPEAADDTPSACIPAPTTPPEPAQAPPAPSPEPAPPAPPESNGPGSANR